LAQPEASASRQFHLVHALVGALQQRIDVIAVNRGQADTDARTEQQGLIEVFDGRGDRLGHGVCNPDRLTSIVDSRQYDDKLVATDSGDRIGPPYTGEQSAGDGLEDDIAARMTTPVVDLLETVEIEVDEGERVVARAQQPFRTVIQ